MKVFCAAEIASLSGPVIRPTVSLGLALVVVKRFAKRFEVFIRLVGLIVARGSAVTAFAIGSKGAS